MWKGSNIHPSERVNQYTSTHQEHTYRASNPENIARWGLIGPNTMGKMNEELQETSQLNRFLNNEKYKTSLEYATKYYKKFER